MQPGGREREAESIIAEGEEEELVRFLSHNYMLGYPGSLFSQFKIFFF